MTTTQEVTVHEPPGNPPRDAGREGDDVPSDPVPADSGNPMEHRFAADEEVADGAAGADEARTPGMGA